MAARVTADQPDQTRGDVEKGRSPEPNVVRGHSWRAVAPIVTIIGVIVAVAGSIVGSVFWLTDRVEQQIEREIRPINDAVTSMNTKFDRFESTYAEDKLGHIKEFHINRSGTGDD